MLTKQTVSIIVGILTMIFSSFALLTHNADLLLLPPIQFILGLVTAGMLVSGITSFRNKTIGTGLFFTFITLFLLSVIILNNTMTMEGFIPVLTMFIVFGVPIGIIGMFANRINVRDEL
ncbi:hypothetical protein [Oceanobacillus manasiensis]|uniref:hypothetical protein n=1 Tax=Oceanobacillus manasiensis TaxID=586413 RepID=UPI0005A832AE|nr:hypothetical protein [Oceanobacillus manasiensis]